MGKEVVFDYSRAAEFISAEEMENFKTTVMSAKDTLVNKSGAGNDFLGWIDLPLIMTGMSLHGIKKGSGKIQGDSDVLLVIGIGGSYLGARAAIEFLTNSFTMCFQRRFAKPRRSISWETASAVSILQI